MVPPTISKVSVTNMAFDKNGRVVVNSPCRREPSLAQVCSDTLANVAVHVHQSCDGGFAHLHTHKHTQGKAGETGVHVAEAAIVAPVKQCSLSAAASI